MRSRRLTRAADVFGRAAFIAPAGVLLLAVLAYPILYTIEISFSELDLGSFAPTEFVGWDNYQAVLEDERFWTALRVTAVYLALALPLQMVLGFGIAFLVNAEWRGRGVVRAMFIIPMVVAPVVAGGVWRMLIDPLWGIVNWALGFLGIPALDWLGDPTLAMITIVVIDTWRWTPFVTLIATAALLSLPKDVFEAAAIDGANWWRVFWSITLPLLVPIIAATFVVRWLGAVKMFDIALAATLGGPGRATSVLSQRIYQTGIVDGEFGYASAISLVLFLLVLVITLTQFWFTKRVERS